MATGHMVALIQNLRKSAILRDGGSLTDAELLGAFLAQHDEVAFEALVRRHGPIVLGVCRRLLGNVQDAEDAFQATFLVLVRKAASVAPREAVGNWLYGVAYRTAQEARRAKARRGTKEKQVKDMPHPQVEPEETWKELQPLLDQELSSLPEKLRLPVVLCDLEGRTRKEVARRLQIPDGTLSNRLATARKILAKRLARHGLSLSGGAVATMMSQNAASACVPASLIGSTVKAATSVAAGKAVATALVSAKVAALTEGVLRSMFLIKLKTAMAVLLLLGMIGVGGGLLTQHTAVGQPSSSEKAEAQAKTAQKQDKKEEGVKKPESTKKNLTLDKALKIAKAMDITEDGEKIRLLAGIGAAQARAGDKQGAGKTFQLALDLVKDVGKKNGLYKAGAFGEIARQQLLAGDLDGARKALAAVKDLHEKTDDDTVKLNAGFIIAGIQGQLAAAQGDVKDAWKMAQEIEDLPRRINAYRMIALEQAKRKDFSGAVATVAKADSKNSVVMLMEVAKIQENTDKAGAAKTWKLVVDALGKLEEGDFYPSRGGIDLELVIRALAERGHGDAAQQWIDGLSSPEVQVRLLLILADRK